MEIGHTRLPVFVSYAHEDNQSPDRWLDRLLQTLKPLRLNNMICTWSDKDIELGSDWRRGIDFQLERYAEAAVLLVSPAYLASDFIRSSELPVLLRWKQESGLLVIPMILRHRLFAEALFRYPTRLAMVAQQKALKRVGAESLHALTGEALDPALDPIRAAYDETRHYRGGRPTSRSSGQGARVARPPAADRDRWADRSTTASRIESGRRSSDRCAHSTS